MSGNNSVSRFIGIMGDGSTDREIIAYLVEVILKGTGNSDNRVTPILLHRQNIRDDIDKFWREYQVEEKADKNTSILNSSFKNLESAVANVLFGATADFEGHIGRPLTKREMIILCSDSEKVLRNKDAYFEEWAWMMEKIIQRGIEKYYHTLSGRGHSVENLPLTVPVIPFPSTDVLIASAKSASEQSVAVRGRKANELKTSLYGTDNLSSLKPDGLEQHAFIYLTNDNVQTIYRDIPEVRTLFQTLCCIS